MRISDALRNVQRLYIDSAPFIYYVEDHPQYSDKMEIIFDAVNSGVIEATTSVITLTETLAKPLKTGDQDVQQAYRTLLQDMEHITLISINAQIAEYAAELRAQYNLRTPDALHVASAADAGCDAFLTNDLTLRRIEQPRIFVLDELELDMPQSES